MTGYNGQRADELSQFLANGNAITSPSDGAPDQEFDFQAQLEHFTNIQFTEFDPSGLVPNNEHAGVRIVKDESAKRQKTDRHDDDKEIGFANGQHSGYPPTKCFISPHQYDA